ncbi:MAG: phage minor head protein [Rhizomicrobium sp.]
MTSDLNFDDLSPEAALEAWNQRDDNPTESYSWYDVWQQQHSQAFTVAKTAGADVLDDIAQAVENAIANGETFDQFVADIEPILVEKGWWGTGPAFDPVTGQLNTAQLGSLNRLRIIYDTNLRMSYAAGKWAGIERTKGDLPYLMYAHTTSIHPRIEHLAWDGITLPVDDPWWATHYPPNGWGCKCGVIQLTRSQYNNMNGAGLITAEAPGIDWRDIVNPRTGDVTPTPAGIDPGFAYNVGKAFLAALAGG